MAYDWRIWDVFSRATVADWDRVRTRFPVELDRATILCPHLYGFRTAVTRAELEDDEDDFYTETTVPEFMVFAAVGAAHLEFLRAEVVPCARRVPHVVLADVGAFAYEEHRPDAGSVRRGTLGELPALLNDWLGEPLVLPSGLDPLAHPMYTFERDPTYKRVRSEVLASMSDAPLRLWDAFLLRGHAYRWELVDGEVPLVGELPTPLLANRSLLRCVADAEALEDGKATDEGSWIRIGRYRLRQRETLLEIRVRMTPPDIRVAFLPSHREPASLGLPTLAGVMLAGGSKGKTEMMNGYTDSTVRCRTPDEARALAASLRSTLLERCGVTEVRVCEDGEDAHRPSCDSGIWSIDCHDRYLTLESPSFRGGTAPVFDVLGGNYWARDVEPPIAFLHRYEKDTTEEVAPRLATAFRQGTREVWVVDHGRSAHVAVFRTPDKGQVYMPGDVIPGSETFPRDVPVSAFVRKKRDDELLELLRSR